MLQFLALMALDLAGLVLIWFLLRARLRRFLELENLLSGVREEARALVTELNETADRNVSLVEDRIVALRALLDDVDRRMGVARRELASRDVEREVFERLSRRRPIVPEPASAQAASPGASSDAGREVVRSAATSAVAPRGSAAEEPSREDSPIPLSLRGALRAEASAEGPAPRRVPEIGFSAEQIMPTRSLREEAVDLYRKGFSADIIAARLGATVAEIELVVEMEERRVGAGASGGAPTGAPPDRLDSEG